MGTQKRKKPPLEPELVAGVLSIEVTPEQWSERQWKQAKALMLMGWNLFNRRQDFSRLQPCDLRFGSDPLLGPLMEVLIRYAKNDKYGQTRAPKIAENLGDPSMCPVKAMRDYMEATGIAVCEGCDKEWGKPYACKVCPPLFPTILGDTRGGVRDRAMPDSRVSVVLKRLMNTLAKLRPDLISEKDAETFSAKSLRCGGVSAAAAAQIRDGVQQGHGGWKSKTGPKQYDLVMRSEQTLVSKKLTEMLANIKAGAAVEAGNDDDAEAHRMDCNDRVARVMEDGGESTTDDEPADGDFEVLRVEDVKIDKGARYYKVIWEPHEVGSRMSDVTWEPEVHLQHLSHKVAGFWRSRKGQLRKTQGLKES